MRAPWEPMTLTRLPLLVWRCPAAGCPRPPVLAYYTSVGGAWVRQARRQTAMHYIVDLQRGPLDARCPVCGKWVRLERTDQEIRSGLRPGTNPDVT